MSPTPLQKTSSGRWEPTAGDGGIDRPTSTETDRSVAQSARRPFLEQRSRDVIEIVGVSAAIRHCIRQANAAGGTDVPVLLSGEPGTGKDLFARFVHQRSRRYGSPFVAVDCAGLPEVLLESKLFGHERGAYTGAEQRCRGRLETARGGSVLLNDVSELPLRLQAKLMRVLEDGHFERLGGSNPCRANVRILAATSRDLTASVRIGAFRKDLFLQLTATTIHLPPLREHPEDVPLMAYYLLGQLHPDVRRIDDTSLAAAEDYAWPGNARELRNVLERAVILADGPTISLDLPRAAGDDAGASVLASTGGELATQIRELKVRAIQRALTQTGGNRTRAAKLLGLDPASLFRMARRLGLWPQVVS